MIVSHFELLFKPQAPGAAAGTAVERVVQGYFLKITNLETRELQYEVEFLLSPPAPTLPQRSLAGNTIYFVDTPPGTDNQAGVLSGAATASVFRLSRGFIRIPAQGTALLAVLPSVFGSAFDPTPLTTPNFEVRGHVNLKLPALFPPGPPFSLFSQPQSDRPVRVLLTPQSRATFFSATNAITDQVQATLPLATGSASVSLDPEPGRRIVLTPFEPGPRLELIRDALAQIEASPTDLLATVLAGLEPSGAGLAAFNASLAKARIPFALQAGGRK